jgi:MoaA/NifB/PqqE/SkfB family radical SAM enzyme/protein-L-isoaspartate O-methyltransferase
MEIEGARAKSEESWLPANRKEISGVRGDEFFVEISKRPPFTKLHPKVAEFFKDYFAHEKVIRFGDRVVVNTHFPPYPSRAFDTLADGFRLLGDAEERRLYSVTLAVTNRCTFDCWHCYNAGRSQEDLPFEVFERLVPELQRMQAVMITLTGGEPLLREDLERIARLFDDRSCLIVGTTGAGLTADRAKRLRDGGLFGVGVSLDSTDEREHDRLRGREGAFRMALGALQTARDNDLYPYIVSVATRDFLRPEEFMSFMRFAADAGALEVHLLEPSATGKLADQADVLLTKAEREQILDYQRQIAQDGDLPILSSYAYLESADAFGCGAGLTHIYIDGSGEVCPCQFAPLSFGNVADEPLGGILDRMGCHFRKPRPSCIGRVLGKRVDDDQLPTPAHVSPGICEECLPSTHAVPRFFQILSESHTEVGRDELESAYDRVHGDYDEFWLVEAGKPVEDLVSRLPLNGSERLFEAGCGTGYATALLAKAVGSILAADLSEGMLAEARQRVRALGVDNVRFVAGDALELLTAEGPFDVVFSSWVLGYIPLKPFFAAATRALPAGGRLAFVVHKENSPREPLEIFAELVARNPSVLQKRVAFDFPRDMNHVRAEMVEAGLEINDLWDGAAVFHYARPEDVLEHLLKSGAGTAFYDAIDAELRQSLADEFVGLLAYRHRQRADYEVSHEYVACVASKR